VSNRTDIRKLSLINSTSHLEISSFWF